MCLSAGCRVIGWEDMVSDEVVWFGFGFGYCYVYLDVEGGR